jgi:hypothetical protein
MIDLGSIAGLHEHRHELHAYCQSCNRWSVLPLANLVAGGRGSLRLPFAVRCRDCGKTGRLQVRPPMPLHPRAVGWMEPLPAGAGRFSSDMQPLFRSDLAAANAAVMLYRNP